MSHFPLPLPRLTRVLQLPLLGGVVLLLHAFAIGVASPSSAWAADAQVAKTLVARFDPHPERVVPQRRDRDKEYKVKALLLLKLFSYATYPKDAFEKDTSPYVILIVGDDPFDGLLQKVFAKKKHGKRTFVVKTSKRPPKSLDAHLVFTSGLSSKDEKALFEAAKKKPCILVGETEGFAHRGGFINFYTQKGKVRLEINKSREKDTKIKLAAELLKLARVFEDEKPKDGDDEKKGGDEKKQKGEPQKRDGREGSR